MRALTNPGVEQFRARVARAVKGMTPELAQQVVRRAESLMRAGLSSTAAAVAVLRDETRSLPARRRAAWLLSIVADRSALDAMAEVLTTARDRILIWEVAKALRGRGGKRMAARLRRLPRSAASVEARTAAAWLLGNLRDRGSVAALLGVAGDDDKPARLREHAIEALGRIGNAAAVPTLVALLDDPSAAIRFWSAYALGEIGDSRAMSSLRRLARTDRAVVPKWGRVSREARAALRYIRDRSATPVE